MATYIYIGKTYERIHIDTMLGNNWVALDQYTDICTEAINVSGEKLTKSFQKVLLDVILLTVIITGKKNFTQFGRCIMLRAHQTPSQKELNLRDKSQVVLLNF